jgi:alanyl-tRNA synthetase
VESDRIRREFLSFFAERGHTVVASSSLVPANDPSLFFTNAGMVQFKDVFTGQETRAYTRATTAQKVLRVSGKHNDLENVGRTPRHHTMFEMLGNFSFGDYFKADAIPMAWELLTRVYRIPAERLWVTVFDDDDEAHDIWRGTVGLPAERIQRMGAKDNFWSMGDTGPCGPCSEIFFDHGPAISPIEGGPAGDSPRYVEICNNVFMQFEQRADGTRLPLPRPSIDTGMGLERLAAVLQGVFSNYDTDLFVPLIHRAAREASRRLGDDPEVDVALRVIADHSRATAFLVADGVMPANDGRGYVLRRIMRRAIRFGVKIGIERPFLSATVSEVIDRFSSAYPEIAERRRFVEEVVLGEEERFRRTLDRGMRLLDQEIARAGRGGTIPGEVAFTLSDTCGFPLDLTEQIAEERGVRVDAGGFQTALAAQRQRGREAWKGSGEQSIGELWHRLAQELGATRFTGYDRTDDAAAVIALVRRTTAGDAVELTQVDRLEPGETGIAVLENTPFYAESGGQVGDSGALRTAEGEHAVRDTTAANGLSLHHLQVGAGGIQVGAVVAAQVDASRRAHTRRNHTATHLLHKALRTVLGEHVAQKGSLVAPDRLRFDFSHHRPMTADELRRVENMVNAEILHNHGVGVEVMDLDAAMASGAMALFGEKYGNRVRVVSVPGYSVELCGGTHVGRTGDIGLFRIESESGVAAGIRRIEAVTGQGALASAQRDADALATAAERLKTSPNLVADAVARLQDDRRALERKLDEALAKLASAAAGALAGRARDIDGIKVLSAEYDGDLKEQADRLRDQIGSGLVVLGSRRDGRVSIVAAVTRDLAGTRLHAGKVIEQLAPLVGGRGGGRPDLAQAGGREGAGLDQALERVYSLAAEMLAPAS